MVMGPPAILGWMFQLNGARSLARRKLKLKQAPRCHGGQLPELFCDRSAHNITGVCGRGPELGSRTGGGGAAVPYGEQRHNERLHLLVGLQRTDEQNSMLINGWCIFIGPGTGRGWPPHGHVDIRHRASHENARSSEARAVCLTSYPPGRSGRGASRRAGGL